MKFSKILKVEQIGEKDTVDLEINNPNHNFLANGIVVSNSHAVAYSSLAAQTIYLKFKYPQFFYHSLLKMTKFEPDSLLEISKIQRELHHFGIKLLPPHILKSQMDFSIEGNDIRFGLTSVKGISDKSIEKLNSFKNDYANKFEIFQAAEEAHVPIGVLSSLIQVGSLENFSTNRAKTVLECQLWKLLSDREKKFALQFAPQFDFSLFKVMEHMKISNDEKNKPIIKPTRMATIRKKYDKYKEIYTQNSKNEKFANWYYENKLLGYSYHETLRDIFIDKVPQLIPISKVLEAKSGTVCFVGTIKDVKRGIAKNAKKTKYVKFIIVDECESAFVMIFNDKITDCEELNGKLPGEDSIVIVRGQRKGDAIFADLISSQNHQIFMKLSELKDKNVIDDEPKKADTI